MGTFHQGKSELHGITVVVDTSGAEVYVGRCDDMNESGILLEDVDVHRDGEGGLSKEDYVAKAARVGIWVKQRRVFVPGETVVSVRRLGEIAAG